jgi:hypothetical protein
MLDGVAFPTGHEINNYLLSFNQTTPTSSSPFNFNIVCSGFKHKDKKQLKETERFIPNYDSLFCPCLVAF